MRLGAITKYDEVLSIALRHRPEHGAFNPDTGNINLEPMLHTTFMRGLLRAGKFPYVSAFTGIAVRYVDMREIDIVEITQAVNEILTLGTIKQVGITIIDREQMDHRVCRLYKLLKENIPTALIDCNHNFIEIDLKGVERTNPNNYQFTIFEGKIIGPEIFIVSARQPPELLEMLNSQAFIALENK